MNTRISKQAAIVAATAIADDLYSKKIEEAKAVIDAAAAVLVRKLVPAPVLALAKEYPDYVGSNTYVSFKSYNEAGYLRTGISANLPFNVPSPCTSITISGDDFDYMLKLYKDCNVLVSSRRKDIDRFSDALFSLRTINAVRRSMPEALKYLHVPSAINPPARVYDDLRQILQTLNTKDNEKDTSSDSQK